MGCKTYVLEIEEDGVEAEEHEANTGGEPVEGRIPEGVHINPDGELRPFLGFAEYVFWVGDCE